ncbi:MAG: PaaI family thioesterase [Bowdeniella nasicola]|nr:PaaI family thioesterase [Bowdeniella nasicola]
MGESPDFFTRWREFYATVDDLARTLALYPITGSAKAVRLGMPLRQEVTQPAGMFSAPALFGLADVAGTWLAKFHAPQGQFPLAVQSSINLLSNTKHGDAIATATIVRAGRTLVVTDTAVFDHHEETMLAKVVTTYVIPQPRS